jgi:hypothetical protein
MCRIAGIFLLQRQKGSAPKKIHAILPETSGEHAPWYDTVKNWVAQFKRDNFSTCDSPRPVRHNTHNEHLGFIYDMIYLFTAIGLSLGGSSTVHIYTQTIHRTIQNKQYIEQHNNFG